MAMSNSKVKFKYSDADLFKVSDFLSHQANDNHWLLIGLRLEDYESSARAKSLGFIELDEITFVKLISKSFGFHVGAAISDMHSLFISSYLICIDASWVNNLKSMPIGFIKNSVVGPINGSKRKKECIELGSKGKFFDSVKSIVMLNSMESSALVLTK